MATHTPGPWRCSRPLTGPRSYTVDAPSRANLATVWAGPEGAANATLICEAPSLLQAVEEACEDLERLDLLLTDRATRAVVRSLLTRLRQRAQRATRSAPSA